jgi:hypothetical protein
MQAGGFFSLALSFFSRVQTQLKLRDMWLKDIQESRKRCSILQACAPPTISQPQSARSYILPAWLSKDG